ncbi:MAG: threonine aldolase, partial [Candidatus Cloacimonetes bacterium]|nr:threonine aldolase [Candidatus Cloacimonadota bacterium]
ANRMSKILAEQIADIPQIEITRPVEINQVFVKVPRELIEPLQKEYFFYTWDDALPEVRWMTSFDTTEQNVINFVAAIKRLLKTL